MARVEAAATTPVATTVVVEFISVSLIDRDRESIRPVNRIGVLRN
jgi:hypothetical protein